MRLCLTAPFAPNTLFPMDDIPATPSSDPKDINRARFELELEFVQSLANPFYLHSLAQQNFLEQPAFINFLEYLLYFKEKDYARFIQCVRCLSVSEGTLDDTLQLSTCTASSRAAATRPISLRDEERRILQGISSSETIRSLENLVSTPADKNSPHHLITAPAS